MARDLRPARLKEAYTLIAALFLAVILRIGPASGVLALAGGRPWGSAPGQDPSPGAVRHVVIVIVDGISLEDLVSPELPNIKALMDRGAIGLMNTRTARLSIPRDTYITIGAGTRACGPPEAGYALNAWEHWEDSFALDVYRRNVGVHPPGDAIVHPFIAGIVRANSTEYYAIVPGLLGRALHDAGFRTAVLGNADTPGETARYGACILMDDKGIVDMGDVGAGLVLREQEFPGGWRTDIKAVVAAYEHLRERAQVIAIELGDTARLERKLQNLPDNMIQAYKLQALASADEFIGMLIPLIDWNSTRLFLITPTPPLAQVKTGGGLTPVVVAGKGIAHGLLVTPTTRRPGIVTNLDIAPTILASFGIPVPYPMLGRPMGARPDDDPLGELLKASQQINATRTARSPILKTFVTLQVIGFIGSLLFLVVVSLGVARQATGALYRAFIPGRFMVALCCVPLVLLVLPFFGPVNLLLTFLLVIGLTGIATLMFTAAGRGGTGAFTLVALITCLAVLLDTTTGANLMKYSILGYDFVGGARYYGIGNEYEGVVIGSALVGTLTLGDVYPRLRRFSGMIAFCVLTWAIMVFGSPTLGADLGGILSALAGLLGGLVLAGPQGTVRRNIKWSRVGLLILGAGCLVVIIAALDSLLGGGGESHLGKTLEVVKFGGPRELLNIIARKLGMNLRLIRYTIWTKVLISAIVVLGVLCVWPVEALARILKRYPGFGRALTGTVVGAGAAFFLNDSGVVAAATVMLFPVAMLLHLAMEDVER